MLLLHFWHSCCNHLRVSKVTAARGWLSHAQPRQATTTGATPKMGGETPTTIGKLLQKMISTWGVWGNHHVWKHPFVEIALLKSWAKKWHSKRCRKWHSRNSGTGTQQLLTLLGGSENEFPVFFWVDYRRLIQLNPLTELLRETTQQVEFKLMFKNNPVNRHSNRKWIIWRSLSLL